MSAAFDPYYQWLSIPPAEQPPHHYRLLGLELFESNLDVIDGAADRQMKHLRDCAAGKHADDSQRLLSEVAAARLALLDAEKKAAYDAKLRATIDAKKKAKARQERPLAVATPLAATWGGSPDLPETPAVAIPTPSVMAAHRQRGSQSLAPVLIAGGVLLLLVIAAGGAAVVFWPKPAAVASAGAPETSPPPVVDTPPPSNPPETITPPPPPPVIAPSEEAAPVDDADDPEEPDDSPTEPPTDQPNPPDEIAPPEAAPQKLAVPSKEIRDQKRQQIAAIFPVDKAGTFEEKGELAANLIRTARDTENDPPAQFALLNLAREQAAEAGQIKLAFEAIEQLDAVFEFPADNVRVASLDQAAKAAIPPAAKREVVTLGMEMIDGFIAADQFDKAQALAERLLTVARPIRDAELTKSLADQRRTIDDLAADYRKAKTAFETLKTSPDDPEANLAAGRYLTFIKQDFDAGLAHLAKSSDAILSNAAKLELAKPQAAADQEKLADAWWAAAEAEKQKPYQDLARACGGYWYRQAAPKLSGLAKAKAEKRISEAPEWTDPRTSRPSTSTDEEKWTDLLDGVDVRRNVIFGSWGFHDDAVVVEAPDMVNVGLRGSRLKLPYNITGSYEIEIEFTRKVRMNQTNVIFPIGHQHCMLILGAGGNGDLGGINQINKKTLVDNGTGQRTVKFELDRKYRVHISVRTKGADCAISVLLDGKPYLQWAGTVSELSLENSWTFPEKSQPAIGASAGVVAFHSVKCRLVAGEVAPVPDMGIFSRDPAELGQPKPPELPNGKVSDEDLRRLLVGNVWVRTIYNKDGTVRSSDGVFSFNSDGTVIGSRRSDSGWRSSWKLWHVADGQVFADGTAFAEVDVSRREFRSEQNDGTHVYRAAPRR